MAIAINLLKDKYALSEEDFQKEKKFLQYSVVFFVVVTVVTSALGLWTIFLANRLSGIETRIAVATKELASLTDASAEQLYLKSRLQLITSFLDNRSVEREALQKIFSTSIPGVVVSGVKFESDSTILVQLTATDAETFSNAITSFGKSSNFFTQVVNRGVTKGQDGTYQVQLLLTIPRGEG